MSDAPNTNQDKPVVRTLDDIAALMASNREKMQADGHYPSLNKKPSQTRTQTQSQPQPNEVGDTDEDQLDDRQEDQQDDDGADDFDGDTDATAGDREEGGDDAAADSDQAADDAEDSEEQSEAGADAQQAEEFSIDDDDLIEIEGLDEPISFKDLKEAYTADKSTVAHVQETRKAMEEAVAVRRAAVEDSQKVHTAMKDLVDGIDQIMSMPLVEMPSASLKASNPAQYIAQMDAYQADQQRIQQSRSTVLNALDAHRKQAEETHKRLKTQEFNRLMATLPVLKSEDALVRKQAGSDILAAAKHYGFTEQDIDSAADHRLFLMAYDAAQYRKLTGKSTEEKEEDRAKIVRRITSKPKVLRSRGSKPRTLAAEKQVKTIKNKASKTGKPEDVAAFMRAKRQALK
jgi:hypothetical protein